MKRDRKRFVIFAAGLYVISRHFTSGPKTRDIRRHLLRGRRQMMAARGRHITAEDIVSVDVGLLKVGVDSVLIQRLSDVVNHCISPTPTLRISFRPF